MTRLMTNCDITKFLAVLAASSVLTACDDHNWRDGFRGRSDLFVYRDINGDDRITRPEWERRYGTVINDPMIVWFDEMDCEGDGLVTWAEYYDHLFQGRESCPLRPAPFPSGYRGNNLSSEEFLGAVTYCETNSDLNRAMKSHREERLTPTQAGNVEIECAAPVLGEPPYIGNIMGRCSPREDSPIPRESALYSRVSIQNKNDDTTISLVTLSVNLNATESADVVHLKTVSVPPKSEQVVTAWFSNNAAEKTATAQPEITKCELHSVLGH